MHTKYLLTLCACLSITCASEKETKGYQTVHGSNEPNQQEFIEEAIDQYRAARRARKEAKKEENRTNTGCSCSIL